MVPYTVNLEVKTMAAVRILSRIRCDILWPDPVLQKETEKKLNNSLIFTNKSQSLNIGENISFVLLLKFLLSS